MSKRNRSRRGLRQTATRFATALVIPSVALIACGGSDGSPLEEKGSVREALTADAGTITISGTVADAQNPQAGIVITLSGSAQGQIVTSFSGTYSFTVAPGGSYSLTASGDANFFQPPFQSCLTITPSVVNLNDLTASTVINFVGAGNDVITNCAPAASSGATAGSLTLAGTVTSAGEPVPGVRVTLNGSAQGYRTTDETGAYSFAVNDGSYSLSASGACSSITPGVVNLNNVKKNATQNFVGTSCPPAPLLFCPTFDTLFGVPEPTSCNTVSTTACANNRLGTWAGDIEIDYLTTVTTDCQFGLWEVPPIVNDFINDVNGIGFAEEEDALGLFALQLFGCALQGNLDGPLQLAVSLVPPDLINAGLTFTTADLAALSGDYISSINQALAANGSPPLTKSQTAAISAQLSFAASKYPGVISSSKLSYSTCP
jgi:hypothetical protein